MKQETLIGMVYDFMSLLVSRIPLGRIRGVYLFGSVARGDFDESSDIDVFVDTSYQIEKDVQDALKSFGTTQRVKWHPKQVKQDIKVVCGNLTSETWKELRVRYRIMASCYLAMRSRNKIRTICSWLILAQVSRRKQDEADTSFTGTPQTRDIVLAQSLSIRFKASSLAQTSFGANHRKEEIEDIEWQESEIPDKESGVLTAGHDIVNPVVLARVLRSENRKDLYGYSYSCNSMVQQ